MGMNEKVKTWTPEEASACGMMIALHAQAAPERPAILSQFGDRSFGALNAHCNQLVRAFRSAGLQAGDGVALICANRPEFVEVIGACQRSGIRVTPINWHLTGEEMGYIVDNCEAKAVVADARFAAAVREAVQQAPNARFLLAVGGEIDGFLDYGDALAEQPAENIEDPSLGQPMLYTSGTTGHPKGVHRTSPAPPMMTDVLSKTAAFRPGEDLGLVTGPLYHAAPLALNMSFPLANGVGLVLMDRWDAEETLRLVDRHSVTHTHVVPTMFHRMLQLPDDVKSKYDLSSLRWVLHGAAPCPEDTKRRTIEWLGPVVYEYYAATEGGGIFITSEEWLKKPGSVGRAVAGVVAEVHDEEHRKLPPGEVGTIYFRAPESGRFTYFKDTEKTASAYHDNYYTMGDKGYVDEDGYFFLTGRSAEQIISGGVNIYPAEIDAVLITHPAVLDVATIGVPDEEWGEAVRGVVQLLPGTEPSEDLAAELIEHCHAHLARYKCPRAIDFISELPRLPTGKILRRIVREPYWAGHGKSI